LPCGCVWNRHGDFGELVASLTMESGTATLAGPAFRLAAGRGTRLGYLLAPVAARLILPAWGWRGNVLGSLVPGSSTALPIGTNSRVRSLENKHRVPVSGESSALFGIIAKSFSYLVLDSDTDDRPFAWHARFRDPDSKNRAPHFAECGGLSGVFTTLARYWEQSL